MSSVGMGQSSQDLHTLESPFGAGFHWTSPVIGMQDPSSLISPFGQSFNHAYTTNRISQIGLNFGIMSNQDSAAGGSGNLYVNNEVGS